MIEIKNISLKKWIPIYFVCGRFTFWAIGVFNLWAFCHQKNLSGLIYKKKKKIVFKSQKYLNSNYTIWKDFCCRTTVPYNLIVINVQNSDRNVLSSHYNSNYKHLLTKFLTRKSWKPPLLFQFYFIQQQYLIFHEMQLTFVGVH